MEWLCVCVWLNLAAKLLIERVILALNVFFSNEMIDKSKALSIDLACVISIRKLKNGFTTKITYMVR